MSELRLNPLTGRWVTIASTRQDRPGDLVSRQLPIEADPDLPIIRMTLPDLVDMNLPLEGVFHNCAIVSVRKRYPGHAKKLMAAVMVGTLSVGSGCAATVAKQEMTRRRLRLTSTFSVRKSVCFHATPKSSSCMQIALGIVSGLPSLSLTTQSAPLKTTIPIFHVSSCQTQLLAPTCGNAICEAVENHAPARSVFRASRDLLGDPGEDAVDELRRVVGAAVPAAQLDRGRIALRGRLRHDGAVLGLHDRQARVSGSVRVAGTEVVGAPERTLRRLRGNEVAMVFQDYRASLFPWRRVGANVEFPLLGRVAADVATADVTHGQIVELDVDDDYLDRTLLRRVRPVGPGPAHVSLGAISLPLDIVALGTPIR